jgi:hypothetical protein
MVLWSSVTLLIALVVTLTAWERCYGSVELSGPSHCTGSDFDCLGALLWFCAAQ